jgi:5-formyltetrahydrofolate cyclo-ligase
MSADVSDTGAAGSKRVVRAQARATRRSLPPEQRDGLSRAAIAHVLAMPEVVSAGAILVYASLPDEVDTATLVSALTASGRVVAVPRVCGDREMTLHPISSLDELSPGVCDIPEPSGDLEALPPEAFDVVVVPGIAFDRACRRIGFGGGFYDTLIPRLRAGAFTVGLAFDEQIVDEVPCEEHDRPLDAVATPTALHRR